MEEFVEHTDLHSYGRSVGLLAAGTAGPEDIAIAAASPTELDDHMMTLAHDARVQDLTTVV